MIAVEFAGALCRGTGPIGNQVLARAARGVYDEAAAARVSKETPTVRRGVDPDATARTLGRPLSAIQERPRRSARFRLSSPECFNDIDAPMRLP